LAQNLCALLFFGVSSFFLILVLDAKGDKVLPAAGKGFKTIAMLVAVAAMGCQLAQIYSAIYYRYVSLNIISTYILTYVLIMSRVICYNILLILCRKQKILMMILRTLQW
jgi:hypothetical protein